MRFLVFVFLFCLASVPASAINAPPGQSPVQANEILRGHFLHQIQRGGGAPLQSNGSFTLAPAHGLIWAIETPFATSTVITPTNSIQLINGMVLKMSIRNLQHLYAMVSAALEGNWTELETDYTITQGSSPGHWTMQLVPKPGSPSAKGYSSILVTGSQFIENITMNRTDSGSDVLAFSNVSISSGSLNTLETQAFARAGS